VPADVTFDPEPWRSELLAFLRRMGAAREADDIVQETFLRSVRRPPSGSARPWLYGIALNVLRDRKRAEKRGLESLELLAQRAPAGFGDPAHASEKRELAERAWTLIEQLPERQRAALLLRIRSHFGYGELSEALQCTEATARQHFYLGMKAVRNALLEDER